MECREFLLSRRSIRVFKPEDVPMDLILQALDIARYAPSAKNLQPWEFIVVKDREKLKQLSELHVGAKPLENAPLAIVVLSDKETAPITYLVDGAAVTMYLWLALHCLGLGAVWINTLRDPDKVRKILDIPERFVPVAILAVGYPAEKPAPKPRKSLADIVHVDSYGKKLQY